MNQIFKNLPPCSQRLGRLWDDINGKSRAILTCGGMREVDLIECKNCGGHKVMLKNKITGFSRDDYNILWCNLKQKIKI